MNHSVTLLGREIPLYGICFFCGITLAAFVAFLIVKKFKPFPLFDFACSAAYVMIGALLGSKLLFIAVSFKQIIELNIPLINVIKGGFVFYGGLLGGIVAMLIYCKQFKMKFGAFLEIYAVVLPLGHALGRVGCFFGGCCYGIPYNGRFSVIYTETVGTTPLGVKLLPIQLIEAMCLLFLFAVMMFLYLKYRGKFSTAGLYSMLYSVVRFVLEFFRGDRERGVFFGISTSQLISIGLFIFGLFLLLGMKKKNAESSRDDCPANVDKTANG